MHLHYVSGIREGSSELLLKHPVRCLLAIGCVLFRVGTLLGLGKRGSEREHHPPLGALPYFSFFLGGTNPIASFCQSPLEKTDMCPVVTDSLENQQEKIKRVLNQTLPLVGRRLVSSLLWLLISTRVAKTGRLARSATSNSDPSGTKRRSPLSLVSSESTGGLGMNRKVADPLKGNHLSTSLRGTKTPAWEKVVGCHLGSSQNGLTRPKWVWSSYGNFQNCSVLLVFL